jgi:hypothetical protein
MARKLFSFYDVDVYEKDASFFERGQWLNDVCINLAFKFIEQEKLTSFLRDEILLFDPAVKKIYENHSLCKLTNGCRSFLFSTYK